MGVMQNVFLPLLDTIETTLIDRNGGNPCWERVCGFFDSQSTPRKKRACLVEL
jgi:hypothetical protein